MPILDVERRGDGVSFPHLDSYRGVAVFLVIAFHTYQASGSPFHPSIAGTIIENFNVGVPIFFVLSGFLLSGPFLRAIITNAPFPSIAKYARNRALRILPAYYLALAILLPLENWSLLGHPLTYLPHFFFLQNFSLTTYGTIINPAWSLCVEVAFYVLLPFVMAFIYARQSTTRRRSSIVGLIVVMIAVAFLFRFALLVVLPGNPLNGQLRQTIWHNLPDYTDVFGLGLGLAYIQMQYPQFKLSRVATIGCFLAGTILFLIATAITHVRLGYTLVNFLEGLCAIAIVAPSVLNSTMPKLISTVLGSKVLRFTGQISYALFLWHAPLIPLLNKAHLWHDVKPGVAGYLMDYVELVLVTGCVAAASYYLFERPFLRRKKLWMTKREPAIGQIQPLERLA